MFLLKFVFVYILINISKAEKPLPVIIIDYERSLSTSHLLEPNPLSKVSQSSFTNVLHGVIKKSEITLIFVEDSFCMEDISTKDNLGTPYYNLQRWTNEKRVKFLPSVVEPLSVISQIFRPHVYNVYYIADDPPAAMFEMRFKYYYVYFKDSDSSTTSRVNILRRHDDIIRKVYFMATEISKDVIAFYTGKKNHLLLKPMTFVPVKPIPANAEIGISVLSSGALFRFVDVHTRSIARRFDFNQKPLITEELWESDDKLSTKMAYADFELQFNFSFKTTGWLIDNVALIEGDEEVGVTRMGVGAPLSMSYICSEPLTITNCRDGSQVVISQYQSSYNYLPAQSSDHGYTERQTTRQDDLNEFKFNKLQPLVEVNSAGDLTRRRISPRSAFHNSYYKPVGFRFGPPVNCSPYFTSTILACLFVTAVCLSILFCGVIALFDVLGNDRFDDPSSKINFGIIDG